MNDSPTGLLLLGPSPATALSRLEGVVRDVVVSDVPDTLSSYAWVLLTQHVEAEVAEVVAQEAASRRDLRVLVDLEHLPSPDVLARLLPGRSCQFRRVGSLPVAVLSHEPGAHLTADDLVAIGAAVQAPGRSDHEVEELRATLAMSQAQVRDLHRRVRSFREQVDGLKERVSGLRTTETQLRRRARTAEERVRYLEGHPAVRVARRLRRVARSR